MDSPKPAAEDPETTTDLLRMSVRRLRKEHGVRFHHLHLVAYRLPITGEIVDAEAAKVLPSLFRTLLEKVPGKLIATIATMPAAPAYPGDDSLRIAAAIVADAEAVYSRRTGRLIALRRLLHGDNAVRTHLDTGARVRFPKNFMTMSAQELAARISDRSILHEFGNHSKLFEPRPAPAAGSDGDQVRIGTGIDVFLDAHDRGI